MLPAFYEDLYPVADCNLAARRKGINRFLSTLYSKKRYLSQILKEQGIGSRDIQRLRCQHLPEYLAKLLSGWRWCLVKTLSPAQMEVISRIYGLDGKLPTSLERLQASSLGDKNEVDVLWQQAIARLRESESIQRIEFVVFRIATEFVSDDCLTSHS